MRTKGFNCRRGAARRSVQVTLWGYRHRIWYEKTAVVDQVAKVSDDAISHFDAVHDSGVSTDKNALRLHHDLLSRCKIVVYKRHICLNKQNGK